MNYTGHDRLHFLIIAREWPKRGEIDKANASTRLYRAFWRREIDRSNQTPSDETCLTFPIDMGGRPDPNPSKATREFILRITGIGEPHWARLGVNMYGPQDQEFYESLAGLDASDYPGDYRRNVLDAICAPWAAIQHWLRDNPDLPAMPFWFQNEQTRIGSMPGTAGSSAHLRRDEDAYNKTEAALLTFGGDKSRKDAYVFAARIEKDPDGKRWTKGGLKAADIRHRARIKSPKVQESEDHF